MTAQFLGYLHWNKYRNDFKMIAATSEVDYDQKKLDTLGDMLEDIYSDDGLEIVTSLPDETRDDRAFDILIARLKQAAQFWFDRHGEIASNFLATGGQKYVAYDDIDEYISDIVKKVERRVERDDYQWEWDCFVDQLQYLLDEMTRQAADRHPDLPRPTHVIVAARNIDWRGRSGSLVCEAKADVLLRKITGSHNSPSYSFYWGDQQIGIDDFGNAFAASACEFLHMIMPHHDAVTHADISPVWHANLYDSDDFIEEDDLPVARKRFQALLSIVDRIYGGDQYDRMYGEKIVRPAIYHLVSFDSRGLVDRDIKVLSERSAEEHIDYLMQDVWFDIKQNYDADHPTRLACDDLNGYKPVYWAQRVPEFAEKYIALLAMMEQDDAARCDAE